MADVKIKKVSAREILDSRGFPTVSVTVTLRDGNAGTAAVPSGASTGAHEAHELRDGDDRYGGRGVRRATSHVNGPIARQLVGTAATDQRGVDSQLVALDGTLGKTKLGANAMLGVSMAVARAAAASQALPLFRYLRRRCFPSLGGWRMPAPMCNLINGGLHGGWNLDVQEFMVLPLQTRTVERIRCAAEVFHQLKQVLKKRRQVTAVGDEGGFAPHLANNEAALKLLVAAVKSAGYRLGRDVQFGLDPAASEWYSHGRYRLKVDRVTGNAEAIVERLVRWVARYPIATIEDGLAEDDWDGWAILTRRLGKTVTLIGDDLFVTNPLRLREGVKRRVANAILIKPNQIGTVSETAETMELARTSGYAMAVSHRSGETNDDFIVDLAVAAGADYLKAGSVCRGERVAKWNRLMEIADGFRL